LKRVKTKICDKDVKLRKQRKMLGTGIMTNVTSDLLKDVITNYINAKHSSFAIEVRSADWVLTATVRAFQTNLK
jgi:hypothetical protein